MGNQIRHCRHHRSQSSRSMCVYQTREYENICILFDDMLQSLNVCPEDFVRSIMESTDPHKTIQHYIDDYEQFLEGSQLPREEESTTMINICPPPPASTQAIRDLPEVKANIMIGSLSHKSKSNKNCGQMFCSICRESYVEHDILKRLPCGHSFHTVCIGHWFERHCTCPCCRYEVETDDPVYEVGRNQRMKSRAVICEHIPGHTHDDDDDDNNNAVDCSLSDIADDESSSLSWSESNIYDFIQETNFPISSLSWGDLNVLDFIQETNFPISEETMQ